MTEQDREYQRMYLDEIGIWSGTFWQRMLQAFPGIEGQQLLWSYLFFVIASEDIVSVKCQLKDVLKSAGFPHVLVRCILVEAQTTANELLNLVDDSATEAGHQPSFGRDKRFTHRIVNGEDWVSAISPVHDGAS